MDIKQCDKNFKFNFLILLIVSCTITMTFHVSSRVVLFFTPWISGYTLRSLWISVCAEIAPCKPFYLYALRNSWQHSAYSTDFHASKVWLLRNHLTTFIWNSTYIKISTIKKLEHFSYWDRVIA
jgi:hypothetical protein